MQQKYDLVIIGAGAAGLMCAITAAKRGKNLLVIDHANKVGKKILMSGGGRCNFTNYSVEPSNYISKNAYFCKSALSRYNQWQFISLVDDYQIKYHEKISGQLFCSNSSKDIRDLLLSECQKYGARIKLKVSVTEITKSSLDSPFHLNTNIGLIESNALVIATGGLSIPTMGATGFGYDIAKQFGHDIVATSPALSPLTLDKKWLKKTENLPGNSIEVEVSCNNISFKDAMLFTHKGLSGPAILQISSYWNPGDKLEINLLPGVNLDEWVYENKNARPEIQLKTLLSTRFSQSISEFICQELGFNPKLKQLDGNQILKIKSFINNWVLYPNGYQGYKVAEVTKGGISTKQISSKTFESQLQPGLFFIGEVLDVTGQLGGYNFQWAWSSGYAAGMHI